MAALAVLAAPGIAGAQAPDVTPPDIPTNLTASPGGSTLYVRWSPSTAGDVAGYELQYKREDETVWTLAPGGGSVTSRVLEGLANERVYELRVRAYDAERNTSPYSTPASEKPRAFWLATEGNISRVRALDQTVGSFAFNRPDSYTLTRILGDNPSSENPDYAAARTLTYASYAQFKADLDARRIPPHVQAVLYDPEAWDKTPAEEQERPAEFLERFCAEARVKYTCITLPSPDLAIRFRQKGETKAQAYVRLKLGEAAARYAHVTGVQAQLYAYDLEAHATLVRSVAEQARAANPAVHVISEYTPVNEGKLLEVDQLFSAYASVRTAVAGAYVAIPLAKEDVDPSIDDAARQRRMTEFLARVRQLPEVIPPDTSIDLGPTVAAGSNTAEVHFSASKGGLPTPAGFECRIDAEPFIPCSTPYTTPGLADGAHTIAVRAIDADRVTDATPVRRSFGIEAATPETTIDAAPPAFTKDSTPTIRFSSNEVGSTFACRVDSVREEDFLPCASPLTTQPLADGPHTFEVRATDPAAKLDPTPAAATFVVDTLAPDTAVASGPSGLTRDRTPAFGFRSSEREGGYGCRVGSSDPAAWQPCASGAPIGPLPDGAQKLEVRAADPAGNNDPTPATRLFTIDATPPDTRIDAGPPSRTRRRLARFDFSAPLVATPAGRPTARAAQEPDATFECRLDGRRWSRCTTPRFHAALTPGRHEFEVRARDAAGNVDPSPVSRTWTVRGRLTTAIETPAGYVATLRPPRRGSFRTPFTTVACGRGRGPCQVTATARSVARIRLDPQKPAKRIALGTADLRVGSGRISYVSIQLSREGRAALARAAAVRAVVRIALRERRGSRVRRATVPVLLLGSSPAARR